MSETMRVPVLVLRVPLVSVVSPVPLIAETERQAVLTEYKPEI